MTEHATHALSPHDPDTLASHPPNSHLQYLPRTPKATVEAEVAPANLGWSQLGQCLACHEPHRQFTLSEPGTQIEESDLFFIFCRTRLRCCFVMCLSMPCSTSAALFRTTFCPWGGFANGGGLSEGTPLPSGPSP
eukprot:21402-Amphidinium_carterae.1